METYSETFHYSLKEKFRRAENFERWKLVGDDFEAYAFALLGMQINE